MLQFAVEKFVCRDGENMAYLPQCCHARFGAPLFPVCIATFHNAKAQCDLLLCHTRM